MKLPSPPSAADAIATPAEAGEQITDILEKSRRVVVDRGVENLCHFEIRQSGHWFILDGSVDSETTKTELLALVPEVDRASWIVDKLRIDGRPPTPEPTRRHR